ncbi:MAG TPA: carboxypeptidase regulatory-like domain-containing protein [Candidatus Angelobacter sp.]|nr:carboxypeptidase regulatory-like domain-containing protein [Candidatus Angelobacter sp.]
MKLINSSFAFLVAALLLGCSKEAPAPSAQPAAPAPIAIDQTTAGAVTGVVTFKGAAPKFPLLDMTSDPGCPKKPEPADVVLLKDGKLANVFVYIKKGLPQGTFTPPGTPVVLTQKGCRYSPHIIGIMAGQAFTVLNQDTADHNIHSMSSGNVPFNESQSPTDKPIVKTFRYPEMKMVLECDQHQWMRAYVNVMSHPYFAVSAADGSFTIPDLPPGEYTLAAVHEKFGEQTMKIKVGPKQNVKADFGFAMN